MVMISSTPFTALSLCPTDIRWETGAVSARHVPANPGTCLVFSPRIFLDVRAELVVPPLPALLADAPWEVLSDGAPAALPMLINQPAAEE